MKFYLLLVFGASHVHASAIGIRKSVELTREPHYPTINSKAIPKYYPLIREYQTTSININLLETINFDTCHPPTENAKRVDTLFPQAPPKLLMAHPNKNQFNLLAYAKHSLLVNPHLFQNNANILPKQYIYHTSDLPSQSIIKVKERGPNRLVVGYRTGGRRPLKVYITEDHYETFVDVTRFFSALDLRQIGKQRKGNWFLKPIHDTSIRV